MFIINKIKQYACSTENTTKLSNSEYSFRPEKGSLTDFWIQKNLK